MKESGDGGEFEGMEVEEMAMHEKIAPKRNGPGTWGRPLGLATRVVHF